VIYFLLQPSESARQLCAGDVEEFCGEDDGDEEEREILMVYL
jgi:hypothetical protein